MRLNRYVVQFERIRDGFVFERAWLDRTRALAEVNALRQVTGELKVPLRVLGVRCIPK